MGGGGGGRGAAGGGGGGVGGGEAAEGAVERLFPSRIDEKIEVPEAPEAVALLFEGSASHIARKTREEPAINTALGEGFGPWRRAGWGRGPGSGRTAKRDCS